MAEKPCSFMVLPSVADRASAVLHDAGDAARDTMTQIADKLHRSPTALRIGCAIRSPIGRIAIRICSAQRRSRSQLPWGLPTAGEPKRIRDHAGIEAAKVPIPPGSNRILKAPPCALSAA
jgi:hypothetical protein